MALASFTAISAQATIIASEGKVQGIIDWSSGRGGFAEDDFCPLEFGEWPLRCKNAFLEGYASIRKVPDYKPIMPLLLLSRAVAAVSFTSLAAHSNEQLVFSCSSLEPTANLFFDFIK